MDHIEAGYFKAKSTYTFTSTINEENVSNYTIITEELNNFFAKIGKTVSEPVPSHIASFHLHLKDRPAVNFFMQPTDINKITNVAKMHCRF